LAPLLKSSIGILVLCLKGALSLLLSSWKGIANYLQCGVRSAQRWETECGLPVRRPGGGDRHHVFAFSQDLDEWLGRSHPSSEQKDAPILRQAELRRELALLRARQKQLTAQLREQVRIAKLKGQQRRPPTNNGFLAKDTERTISILRDRAVLTVDDNASSCYALGRILRAAGFHVIEAQSGQRALELALQEHPDLALLDVHLPDISGFELFALLQREPSTKQIPVIFHTASAPQEAASYIVHSLNAEGLIRHPIEPSRLVSIVEATILRNLTACSEDNNGRTGRA